MVQTVGFSEPVMQKGELLKSIQNWHVKNKFKDLKTQIDQVVAAIEDKENKKNKESYSDHDEDSKEDRGLTIEALFSKPAAK